MEYNATWVNRAHVGEGSTLLSYNSSTADAPPVDPSTGRRVTSSVELLPSNMTQRKPVRLIAAACNGLGIGKDGRLPWRLPREFKYFLHNVGRVSRPGMMNLLVWGRLNWYSNDPSLHVQNALHVVLSKTLDVAPENAYFLSEDFEGAIRLATSPALCDIIETIWVVGGSQVYKEGMMHPWCDLIYLTDVMANFDCDVFFPKIDRQLFKMQDSFPGVPSEIQEENGIKYKYQVYKKDICN